MYAVAPALLFYLTACHTHKVITDFDKVTDTKNNSSSKVSTVAGILNMDEHDVKKKKLYAFISDWYGVPYKYGGCDKKGTDCSCFVCSLYSSVYQKKLDRKADDMEANCEKIKESHLKEGDLIFFKIKSKNVSHVGVYLKNNKFVHASSSKGVIINDINDSYYKKYFYCFGRTK